MKLIRTWEDLEIEAEALAEFHISAVEASEAIRDAAAHRSEAELRAALSRFRDLKARSTFRVDKELFGALPVAAPLRLVN